MIPKSKFARWPGICLLYFEWKVPPSTIFKIRNKDKTYIDFFIWVQMITTLINDYKVKCDKHDNLVTSSHYFFKNSSRLAWKGANEDRSYHINQTL